MSCCCKDGSLRQSKLSFRVRHVSKIARAKSCQPESIYQALRFSGCQAARHSVARPSWTDPRRLQPFLLPGTALRRTPSRALYRAGPTRVQRTLHRRRPSRALNTRSHPGRPAPLLPLQPGPAPGPARCWRVTRPDLFGPAAAARRRRPSPSPCRRRSVAALPAR